MQQPYDWDAPPPANSIRLRYGGFEYDIELAEIQARELYDLMPVHIERAREAGRVRPLPCYQPEDASE